MRPLRGHYQELPSVCLSDCARGSLAATLAARSTAKKTVVLVSAAHLTLLLRASVLVASGFVIRFSHHNSLAPIFVTRADCSARLIHLSSALLCNTSIQKNDLHIFIKTSLTLIASVQRSGTSALFPIAAVGCFDSDIATGHICCFVHNLTCAVLLLQVSGCSGIASVVSLSFWACCSLLQPQHQPVTMTRIAACGIRR
jgi:hypothetical protein